MGYIVLPSSAAGRVVSVRGEVFLARICCGQSAILAKPAFDDVDVVGLVEFRASSFQRDHAARGERIARRAW